MKKIKKAKGEENKLSFSPAPHKQGSVKEEPKRVKRVKKTTPVVKEDKSSSPLFAAARVKKERYFEGLGRRKTAIARVRFWANKKEKSLSKRTSFSSPPSLQKTEAQFLINEKPLENYFPTIELQQTILAPLTLMNCLEQFKVSVKVKGGGMVSQAEAVRHGVARALVLFSPDFRKKLKKVGYLKRDPRMRERKKFGLKRARRAPQWSKR